MNIELQLLLNRLAGLSAERLGYMEAIICGLASGALDCSDIDALIERPDPQSLEALASLPSVKLARTAARLRLRAESYGKQTGVRLPPLSG